MCCTIDAREKSEVIRARKRAQRAKGRFLDEKMRARADLGRVWPPDLSSAFIMSREKIIDVDRGRSSRENASSPVITDARRGQALAL
jgi:hypothetical protein